MSALAWFAVWTLGSPALYLLGLLANRRQQRRREARKPDERSVTAIAARVERERKQAVKPVRWPRCDPDRGVVRNERRTAVLPVIGPLFPVTDPEAYTVTFRAKARPYSHPRANSNSY